MAAGLAYSKSVMAFAAHQAWVSTAAPPQISWQFGAAFLEVSVFSSGKWLMITFIS